MIAAVHALLNGEPATGLSLLDRGLHYGDGLFETVRVRQRQPLYWREHLDRLERGCRRLALPFPGADALDRDAQRLLAEQNPGLLKIIVTRGPGERGYRPPTGVANRLMIAYPHAPAASGKPLAVTLCRHRLGLNPALAGVKHLNRLDQILARAEWADEFDEGLIRDLDGNLIEAVASNVFLVFGDTLVTPELNRCGVAGIMRQKILDQADSLGYQVDIRQVDPAEIAQADELFLCNSVAGIRPVASVDAHRWPDHPATRRLIEALNPT